VRRAGLLALALAPSACADELGPLDPEVVAELARPPGDAKGTAFSGRYILTLTIVDCPCTTYPYYSLCPTMGATGTFGLGFTATHGEGLLELDTDYTSLYGRVDADGSFAVGEVVALDTGLLSGQAVSRVDGDFDLDTDGAARVDGELARHVVGDYPEVDPVTGAVTKTIHIDCTERFMFDGTRTSP
jgi:hypothetical protein